MVPGNFMRLFEKYPLLSLIGLGIAVIAIVSALTPTAPDLVDTNSTDLANN